MNVILQVIGSNIFFIWIVTMVLDDKLLEIISDPYGEIILKNRWLFLFAGLVLIIFGRVSTLKQRRKNNSTGDFQSNKHNASTNNDNVVRKDFYTEKQKHNAIEIIEQQGGKLKDLAMKVDWTPLVGGGANFKTGHLSQISSSRIEVLNSSGMKLFSAVFIVMGLGIPGVIGFSDYHANGFEWTLFIPILFGVIFSGVGVLMLFLPRPRYFDQRIGWFWAGKKTLLREQELRQTKKATPLNQIAALQIISEHVSGDKRSYTSWELNLVTRDAKRFNVLDHGDKESLLKDAKLLSEFLSVPVWENT